MNGNGNTERSPLQNEKSDSDFAGLADESPIDLGTQLLCENLAASYPLNLDALVRRNGPLACTPLLNSGRLNADRTSERRLAPDDGASETDGVFDGFIHNGHSRQSLNGGQGIAENNSTGYTQAMPKQPKHIGDRLRDEMSRRNLSHAQVADLFGVKAPSVYDWVNFGRIAKKHIPKLIEEFGHTADWWITGEEAAVSPSFLSMGAEGLADRIKTVIDEAGGNISKVAAAANTTDEVVAGWLSGKTTQIGVDHAVALQETFGVNSVWLMLGKGSRTTTVRYNDPYEPIPITRWRAIPVVGRAQLGDNGNWADMEYPVGHGDGYIDFPTKDPDAYALKCEGDSMRPRIKDGEFVVIEPNQEIQPGDEVLVKSKDGRVMVKEFMYKRTGRTHLISANDAHKPIILPDGEIEKMHFVRAICRPSSWRPE
jgi:phage repressor protein C with HTH and peptisase S24 domain/plasmid maintenance system antidote protein VapI